jgi:hypothetical protein
MLSDPRFYVGVAVGVALLIAWQKYQISKSQG